MKKTLLAASIGLALGTFGLIGVANAALDGPGSNLLKNSGFEQQEPEPNISSEDARFWDQTDAIRVCEDELGEANIKAGYCAMRMHDGGSTQGTAVQEVDISNCPSPYDLAEYRARGWSRINSAEDKGMLTVFGITGETSSVPVPPAEIDDWQRIKWDGNIPEGSEVATVEIAGDDENDGNANVRWDSMKFATDCVDYFSKISGKLGGGRGTHSFDGVFGELDSGKAVGAVEVNYKDLGVSCTFENDGVADSGTDYIEWDTSYLCSNGDAGTAVFTIWAGTGGSNKGNLKDRGAVEIYNATDGEYDIPEANGVLLKGNAHVEIYVP